VTSTPPVGRNGLWECDIAVLTVQDRETTAVLRLVEEVTPQTATDGHTFYRFTVPTPSWHGRRRLTGLVWPLHDVGRVAGAIATTRLLAEAQPTFLFLVGVAGGIAKNGVALGDVVVATSSVDYEMQRLSPQGTEVRLTSSHPTSQLVAAARKAIADVAHVSADYRPNVNFGVVLSGDKVIASDEVVASLLDAEPSADAVEMEGAGVAAAARSTRTQTELIMIRGVVDLANEAKREHAATWGDRACDAVAAYMLATAYRATAERI
jgi:nucleoside phosphorylase